MGGSDSGKPGRAAGYKPQRLRVHEACVTLEDERLGHAAAEAERPCGRCKAPLGGPAVVVQSFPGVYPAGPDASPVLQDLARRVAVDR
jgi:hypothetical protein